MAHKCFAIVSDGDVNDEIVEISLKLGNMSPATSIKLPKKRQYHMLYTC